VRGLSDFGLGKSDSLACSAFAGFAAGRMVRTRRKLDFVPSSELFKKVFKE
jgi:hypothetical protein